MQHTGRFRSVRLATPIGLLFAGAGLLASAVLLIVCAIAAAEPTAASEPDPVPLTRDAMKQALDASKESAPRLPLPPLTDAQKKLILRSSFNRLTEAAGLTLEDQL